MRSIGVIAAIFMLCTSGQAIAQGTAAVQSALALLGYDPGPVDGAWGGKTRTALEGFYADNGRTFSGELGVKDYRTLLGALQSRIEAEYGAVEVHDLDLATHFQPIQDVRFPKQYVFSEGADQPTRSEFDFAVFHPFVHDLDGDGCDDILAQFMDSYAHPYVIRGRPGSIEDGRFVAELAGDIPRTRAIRNAAIRDVNGDGRPDFIGFTAPHGLDGLGYVPRPEQELVVPQGGEAWLTKDPVYAHGGLAGDVNGDGLADIFAIDEDANNRRHALLGDGKGGFPDRRRVNLLPGDFIFDAQSADLNGDGVDDFVLITSRNYKREKQVSPVRASQDGTLAIALGEQGKSIDQLQFTRLGTHPVDELGWAAYGLHAAIVGAGDRGYAEGFWTYSGPSNVDLIDFDGDGDLDILVGYFVSARSSWQTSGFRLFQNDSGQFTDVTAELVPQQPSNLRVGDMMTDAMIGAKMIDVNGDGAKDLLLSVQTSDGMHDPRFSGAIYINVGGRFVPAKGPFSDPTRNLSMLTTGDFNCDGVADIIGSGPSSKTESSVRIILGKP